MPTGLHRPSRIALSIAAAFGVIGCMKPAPTTPVERPPDSSTPPSSLPPPFPPLSRVGVIYTSADELNAQYFRYLGSPNHSHYIFYDDSTFGLQFSSRGYGQFEYTVDSHAPIRESRSSSMGRASPGGGTRSARSMETR